MSTVTRRRPSSKSAPAKRSSAKAAPARHRPSRNRPSLRAALAHLLGRQSDDVWGLALLVAAGLCALGVYSGLAGPAGRILDRGAGDVLGWCRFLLPPALGTVSWALLRESHDRSRRRRPTPRPDGEEKVARPPSRVAFGAAVLLIAGSGIGDLVAGPSHWRGGLAAFRPSGGLIGAAVAIPLRAGVGVWGSAFVLSVVLATAVLILTGTPAREAAHWLYVGAVSVGRAVHGVGRALTSALVGARRRAAAGRHPSTVVSKGPYDVEADEDGIPDLGRDGDSEIGEEQPDVAAETVPAVPIHVPPPDTPVDSEQLSISLGPAAQPGTWRLPPVALLKRTKAAEIDRKQVEALGHTLEDALAAHGVDTRLVGMTVGPTVTRYELELGAGVKVAKVTNLQRDIAYAMAAADVRILAPIPGRSAIGVEVPNQQRQLVAVGDILASAEAHAATHPLEVGLGRDIAGRPVIENLATMPHILIAGATGAGKSSCINSLLTSVLVRATPDQVRLILVDPKRVELGQYNGLPHLLTGVVTNPKKAANALSWAVHEMERRYDLLAEVGVRDITGYNAAFDRGELEDLAGLGEEPRTYERLPFILIVVDELNDLMMVAARDVEESVCRIAQMARAVGIHLVIATQRPSVDVITGVIKANIPSRLAFAVSSLADSRVILDQPGAERLIGKGDMLLLSASSSVARRIQGAWVTEEEVRKVVGHWRRQSAPRYVEGVEGSDDGPGGPGRSGFGDDDDDDLLDQARELVVRSQLGSTSMLQRKLRVGFARAGRLMDLLEQRGVVGPSEGSKARAVMMTVEELENLQESGA
ncbi:MAG TPA: DNA translocase FtsK 4TM domain-containing protein [Acidimicrobiales bacterium]|nr:DNA translocase FtsK 4TM domain-containing protein [Acidimicrobiales bacterium]